MSETVKWAIGLLFVPALGLVGWLVKMRSDITTERASRKAFEGRVDQRFADFAVVIQRVETKQEKLDESLDMIKETLPVIASKVNDLWQDSRRKATL